MFTAFAEIFDPHLTVKFTLGMMRQNAAEDKKYKEFYLQQGLIL